MRRPIAAVAFLLVAGLACSDSSDDGGPETPLATTAFEIQSGDISDGQLVLITTYIMGISSAGDRVWVSDGLGASARAGVEVYRGSGAPAFTGAVGDRITVEGTVQEFSQGSGLTVTQIAEPTLTIVTPAAGAPIPITGLNPAIITLDPVAGISANGEAYEGVLIQLSNIKVASTAPYAYTDGTTTFGAGQEIVPLGDAVGTCYATLTGIWNYDVVADDWIIVPVVGGKVAGSSCP